MTHAASNPRVSKIAPIRQAAVRPPVRGGKRLVTECILADTLSTQALRNIDAAGR
jgi:hypothetical protein